MAGGVGENERNGVVADRTDGFPAARKTVKRDMMAGRESKNEQIGIVTDRTNKVPDACEVSKRVMMADRYNAADHIGIVTITDRTDVDHTKVVMDRAMLPPTEKNSSVHGARGYNDLPVAKEDYAKTILY